MDVFSKKPPKIPFFRPIWALKPTFFDFFVELRAFFASYYNLSCNLRISWRSQSLTKYFLEAQAANLHCEGGDGEVPDFDPVSLTKYFLAEPTTYIGMEEDGRYAKQSHSFIDEYKRRAIDKKAAQWNRRLAAGRTGDEDGQRPRCDNSIPSSPRLPGSTGRSWRSHEIGRQRMAPPPTLQKNSGMLYIFL
jgi:hypothetical protein